MEISVDNTGIRCLNYTLRFRYFGSMERINRIKEVLVSQDKTQVWLAGEIDKSINTVSAFCSNRRQPSLTELKKIAHVLKVDIRDLLIPTL